MVIYRDSDQQVNALEKRRDKSMDIMCAMEELAYNRRMAGSHAAPSNNLTDTSFSGLWDKRDVLDISLPRVTSTTAGCPTARKSRHE